MQYFIEIFTPTKFHEILHHYMSVPIRHTYRSDCSKWTTKVVGKTEEYQSANTERPRLNTAFQQRFEICRIRFSTDVNNVFRKLFSLSSEA